MAHRVIFHLLIRVAGASEVSDAAVAKQPSHGRVVIYEPTLSDPTRIRKQLEPFHLPRRHGQELHMAMWNGPTAMRPPIEDQHIPIAEAFENIPASSEINWLQRLQLRLKDVRVQHKLRSHDAILVQPQCVMRRGIVEYKGRGISIEWRDWLACKLGRRRLLVLILYSIIGSL